MSFTVSLPVRFADCDPAGIAYFPRLLALLDAAIEDWTAATLAVDRSVMHGARRLGLPTVRLETDFHAPARLGTTLEWEVCIDRVGQTSVALVVVARHGNLAFLTARLVQVLTCLDTMRPKPWPADWRDRLTQQSDCAAPP